MELKLTQLKHLFLLNCYLLLAACSNESGSIIQDSSVELNADGALAGKDAYTLIEEAFGNGSIEAPDFYEADHTDVPHIVENTDNVVGHHFVFLSHRDNDLNKGVDSDRQRNEIKVFDNSKETLKAHLNDTMQYSWKFKVTSDMELSSKFSHFFQIKAKNYSDDNSNGSDNMPIVTISGVEDNNTGNRLTVRYNSGNNSDGSSSDDIYLINKNWSLITDEWLDVYVKATFAESGALVLKITRLSDQKVLVDIYETEIDMWRGVIAEDFVRPKWGIYRSLDDKLSLRADEEKIYFSNFSIQYDQNP